MPFKKGHKKIAGRVKESKNKATIIREALGIENINDLKEDVLYNLKQGLNSDSANTRNLMTQTAAKYLFPQKKEVDMKLSGTIIFQVNPKIANT